MRHRRIRMFCQNCGAQMGGAFCNSCGARASQTPPPPPPPPPAQYTPTPPQYAPPQYAQPPYTQPLAPPAKSGSGLKILLVVLGIFLLLGMVAVGGIMYAVHRAKQAIASTTGVDLNSFSEQRHGPARRLDACALLTKDDLSQILNLPSIVPKAPACPPIPPANTTLPPRSSEGPTKRRRLLRNCRSPVNPETLTPIRNSSSRTWGI